MILRNCGNGYWETVSPVKRIGLVEAYRMFRQHGQWSVYRAIVDAFWLWLPTFDR